jgi:hypothetical protein
VNIHEERAWKLLIELGAKETKILDKHALDLSPIRLTTKNKLCLFVQAVIDVVGRSNANRRHVDRRGCPIYVVTDFYTLDAHTVEATRAAEHQAFLKHLKARQCDIHDRRDPRGTCSCSEIVKAGRAGEPNAD